MPTTVQNITEATVRRVTGGDINAPHNLFIRDTRQAGFGITIGRTKSAYFVESRVGKGGKPVRIVIGTVGKMLLDDARKEAQQRLGEMAIGINPLQKLRAEQAVGVTFSDVLDAMALRGGWKASTLKCYRSSVKPWIGRAVASITADEIVQFWHKHKATPTSTARRLRSLRSVMAAARVDHPTLPHWPTDDLRGRMRGWSKTRRKTRVIADSLLPAWHAQVVALDREDVRDLLLLLLFTGCRIGEARALLVENVNMKTQTFKFADTKTGGDVVLPMTRQTAAILARRIGKRKTGRIFAFGDVRKAHADVNAAPWSYHDLRRQFRSIAIRAGIPDAVVRRLQGHALNGSDAADGYLVLQPEALRPFAQKVSDAISKATRARR